MGVLQVSNYVVKIYTKEEGGDEGIGLSTKAWWGDFLHEYNHEGY